MPSKKIVVAILGYNSRDYLDAICRSVLAQTCTDFVCDIVYIDNASTDDSVAFIEKAYPSISIIHNKTNKGYAGAYADAVAHFFSTGYDGVVCINPDVIVDEVWLVHLVASAYARPDIGFAQPLIFLASDAGGTAINSAGNAVHMAGFGYPQHYGEKNSENKFAHDFSCSYASGCALLIRRNVFDAHIRFDEDFFLYYEDQDLGWRGRMHGFDSVVSVRSHVKHHYQDPLHNTWKKKFYYLERNRWNFLYKNFSTKLLLLMFPFLLVCEALVVVHSLRHGYFGYKLRALRDVGANLRVLTKKRLRIQNSRSVPDKELLHFLTADFDFLRLPVPIAKIVHRASMMYYKVVVSLMHI